MFNVGDLVEYDWFGNMEYSRVVKVYQDESGWDLVMVSSGALLPLDCVKKVKE